jgi:hypothetical protein
MSVNNNVAAFNREIWSGQLVRNIDQINVMKRLVNTDWEGDLRQSRTVKVRTLGNVSLSDYTKYTSLSYQNLAPSVESFSVNGNRYFAFEVDDIDKAQTDMDLLNGYTGRAAVAIDNDVDSKILSVYTSAPGVNQITGANAGSGATAGTVTVTGGAVTAIAVGAGGSSYDVPPIVQIVGGGGFGARAHAVLTAGAVTSVVIDNGGSNYTSAPTVTFAGGETITLDSSTTATGSTQGVYPVITQMAEALSLQNVPETGRFLVVDPKIRTKLWNDTAHFVRATDLGDSIVLSGRFDKNGNGTPANQAPGFIGVIAGFDVYMVTHLPTSGGARYMVAGNRDAITYAAQLIEIEAIRLQDHFANAVRGLIAHDATVFNENSKCLATAKVA